MPIHQNRRQARPRRGFTLIELMIVVGIVAILLAIAVPAYNQYSLKARRADAQKLLMGWANNQEIWRANNSSYATAAQLPPPTSNYYNFGVAATANGYTLTATATGSQAADSERGVPCTPMTLDQSGTKDPPVCWER